MAQLVHLKILKLVFYLCWISESVLCQELNGQQDSEKNSGSSYFFYQQPNYPVDCAEAKSQCSTSTQSGVYIIKPDGYPEPFEVFCDNTEDSGGWTVIQRRNDGSIFFNRNWEEYNTGFGFLSQEFWIGNNKLSYLTNQETYELRIDFTSSDGLSFYVKYDNFRISDEYSDYKITSVGEYIGSEDNITKFLCNSAEDGVIFTSPDCSSRCSCTGGQVSCDDTYQCSPNAVCEERNDLLQCYCNEGYTGDGVNCTADIPPSDCQDVYNRGFNESGVYEIKPTTWQGDKFQVYCNMSDGGGWTVFQRRIDGSEDFNQYWSEYKIGFGTPREDDELWIGNEKLHKLTNQTNYEMRIDLVNSLGNPYYAKYSTFRIEDETDNYRLRVGGYTGNAGYDSMAVHNGKAFSTRDRDNDNWSSGSCVTDSFFTACGTFCNYRGGWWYSYCAHSALNSPYGTNCFGWRGLPGNSCNIKYTEMKIRPI